ncbi:hypothetical protein EVAR_8166_1 [Eumeta japonica]|uniref:Uncharacterized protein n=1 Tax=Eumeta variegata TaxID=151549 RepID=A0A4C1TSW2_EUMVA|nr:hypothetical protein EVAR_8166_1 [Eumeta japonica]
MEAKLKSFLAEHCLLKDFEDYCASPASSDSNSEMDFEKEGKSRTTACQVRLEASGAITYGPGLICYSSTNKAKTNSGSASSQDASLAPTPTSSWRNAGAKKKTVK